MTRGVLMPDTLVFIREEGFYPIEAPATVAEAKKHADMNPGTLRIEDVRGNILWEATRQ